MPCLPTSDSLPGVDPETGSCANYCHTCHILKAEISEGYYYVTNLNKGQGYMVLFLIPSEPALFVVWRCVAPAGEPE